MKIKFIFVILFGISINCSSLFAIRNENRDLSFDRTPVKVETVKWIGEIKEEFCDPTTNDLHELKFVKKDDGKKYDIVEGPALEKLHSEISKNALVEIEAEKTPKFLFWGGNLIVKNFKVIATINSEE